MSPSAGLPKISLRCCFAIHALGLWALVFAFIFGYVQQQPQSNLSLPGGSEASQGPCATPAQPSVYFAGSVVLGGSPSFVDSGFLHVGSDGLLAEVRHSSRAEATLYAESHGLPFVDFGDEATVSPGLIDVHVHISALGDRGWEGYESATRAAAAGGITTVIGMPLNSLPPTVTLAALRAEIQAALSTPLYANVGYWGGAIPSSISNGSLAELLADAHVLGVKAFLSPLPSAAGYTAVTPEQLRAAALTSAAADLPVLVHCELMSLAEIEDLMSAAEASGKPRRFETFLQTRPPEFERRAIDALIEIADTVPGLRAHIVHLSDAGSLPRIRKARQRLGGLSSGHSEQGGLSVETCPHYLLFDAESVGEGETRLKCLPPIRDRANNEMLWAGLDDGTIDLISSDHSPCLPEMRSPEHGDFLKAWAGISGLQFGLLATWTAAWRRNRTVGDLARWWSERPAQLAGLWQSKGSLERSKDADFVVWSTGSVAPTDKVFHRHPGSPFAGMQLRGKVLQTFVSGRRVFAHDDASGPRHEAACGRVLSRSATVVAA